MGFQTVFKTDVDVAKSTTAEMGAIAGTGQIRYENGNQYTLVKAGGTIAVKTAVKISAYTSGELIVTVTGDNEDAIGIAMTSVVSGQYFWIQTMGLATAIADAAMAAAYVDLGGMASGYVDDGSTGRKFAQLLETATAQGEDVAIWIY